MKKTNLLYIGIFFLIAACSTNTKQVENIDEKAMLDNVGNIILNQYKDFDTTVGTLVVATDDFIANTTLSNLNKLRLAYTNAYISYQRTQVSNFGPAEVNNFIEELNFFPEDQSLIHNAISTGSFNMATINNKAKGIQALDYLLYAIKADDNAIVTFYVDSTNARNYLSAVVRRAKTISNKVYLEWKNGYITTFKEREGVSASSSIFQLFSGMTENIEKYGRSGKVAFPLGYSGIFPPPNYTSYKLDIIEGRHSLLTLELLKNQLIGFENIFYGNLGLGFDDYLLQIKTNKNLVNIMNTYIQDAKANIEALNEPYADEIVNRWTEVNKVYASLQRIVVLLKNDIASAMSIDLVYQDTDGD